MPNLTQNTNTTKLLIPSLFFLMGANVNGNVYLPTNYNHLINNTPICINNTYSASHIIDIDNQLYESILSFAKKIVENSQDLDAELITIINDNIMDLLA